MLYEKNGTMYLMKCLTVLTRYTDYKPHSIMSITDRLRAVSLFLGMVRHRSCDAGGEG